MHTLSPQVTHGRAERLEGDVLFSHTEGDTQPVPPGGSLNLQLCSRRWSLEGGREFRRIVLGPGRPGWCSDSGALGSGPHSWVLGTHQDAPGARKWGPWESCWWQGPGLRVVWEELGTTQSVCQHPGVGRWGSGEVAISQTANCAGGREDSVPGRPRGRQVPGGGN